MNGHELAHLIKHAVRQQMQDMRLVVNGHVSSYDAEKVAIKVLIPLLRDPKTGKMYETGWLPLGTLAVGDGCGIQWAPEGGATQDDPEKGEGVEILLHERANGRASASLFTFNNKQTAPGAGSNSGPEDPADPDGTNKLQPGELIIKHKSGSFIKMYKSGDVQIHAKQDLKMNAGRDIIVHADRDINITSQGNP